MAKVELRRVTQRLAIALSRTLVYGICANQVFRNGWPIARGVSWAMPTYQPRQKHIDEYEVCASFISDFI